MSKQAASLSRAVDSVARTIAPEDVDAWLTVRLANCLRIAATRSGADRLGWLEDAAYFRAALTRLGARLSQSYDC